MSEEEKKPSPEAAEMDVVKALKITGLNDLQVNFVMESVDEYIQIARKDAREDGFKHGYREAASGLFGEWGNKHYSIIPPKPDTSPPPQKAGNYKADKEEKGGN
jgi:hypothetical protein